MTSRQSILLACLLLAACGPSGKTADPAAATGSAAAVPTPPPAFAMCSSCHAVRPGVQGVGPNLAGVWGRTAGSTAGYAYSNALKTSGIVWNAKTLDTWLQGPMQMVPGTRMVVGLHDAQARKTVIDYLETLK